MKAIYMQVTPELLLRYHRERCTPKELRAVELWLSAEAGDGSVVSEDNVDVQINEEIWAGILQHTIGRQRPARVKRIVTYAVAASVASVIFIASIHLLPGRKIYLANNGLNTTTVNLEQLQVKLEPGSNCQLDMPALPGSVTSMRFCGAIAVTSLIDGFVLRIAADSSECDVKGNDAVKLHKGQLYMAMTDKEYNLIAATREELEDGIPRSFSYRLSEKFKHF